MESRGYRCEVMWECDYLKNHKLQKEDRLPKSRLIPREALRGGRTETYSVYFNCEQQPDRVLEYIDFNRFEFTKI